MYILKNGWKSIARNKGRNILIGIIVLVISCSCCIALAVSNTANTLIDSYENKYDITATIRVNRENMMQNFEPDSSDMNDLIERFNASSNLTLEEIESYADSVYVSSYYYTYSIGLDGKDLEPASMERTIESSGNGRRGLVISRNDAKFATQNSDFRLMGYSSIEAMNEFIEGTYSITAGEVSNEVNTCVINSELATLNGIKVGDTIELVDPNNSTNTYSLKVVGIFTEETESVDAMAMFSNSANAIVTTSETVESILENNSDLTSELSPTFILVNKDIVDQFESELHTKGMNEDLSIQTNLAQIEGATDTISNVSSFALSFLIGMFVIGGIVLLVINSINIRERKYEIGVLRTIGMKKSTLAIQFLLELAIVSLFALVVGAGIGASVSVPVSNKLLAKQIASNEKEMTNVGGNFGRSFNVEGGANLKEFSSINGIGSIEAFDSIDAVVDLKVLAQLLVIALSLTAVSSLTTVVSIQKFSPLTILKERS